MGAFIVSEAHRFDNAATAANNQEYNGGAFGAVPLPKPGYPDLERTVIANKNAIRGPSCPG